MPRYVVLRHEMPDDGPRRSHWDVMLEHHGKLLTWAVDHRPHGAVTIDAMQLPDHRPDYLEYEGPVAGDRGSVTRWDAGTYEWIMHSSDAVHVRLEGERLTGVMTIQRQASGQRWRLKVSSSDSATRG